MKGSFLLCAVLLAALLQAALVSADFDGWIYSGQTITIEDKTFIVYLLSSNMDILADYGRGQMSIVNNSCQQTENVRLCLDNVQYDFVAKHYKIEIRAISLAPDISISRSAGDDEFEAGSGTTITVTIKNDGGLAQNLTYTDEFPDSVEIELVNNIVKRGNKVIWTKKSFKTESETFTYRIKVNDVIDRTFAAKLEYFDGSKMKTIRSSTISFKTTPRLLHEFVYGGGAAIIGEKKNITLNFTNKETSTANINVDLFLDSGLLITKYPRDFKKISDSHYQVDIEIRKSPENKTHNNSQDYYFEFIGTKVGTFSIRAVSKYSTKDFQDRKLPDISEKIAVSDKGVNVRSNLDDLEFESRQARTLRIWLQNLNPAISIKNILVAMDGGGLVELPDVSVESLLPYAHRKVVEKAFYSPALNNSAGYTIEVNVTYLTEFGENFSRKFRFTETVNKVSNMTISHAIGKSLLESGEETTFSVKVKNPRKTKISRIEVRDDISEDFSILGIKKAFLELDAGDEQTAYTYVLKAPRVNKETVYEINTTITYSEENAAQKYYEPQEYKVTKSSKITVKPQKFELTATRAIDDSSLYIGDFFDVAYTIKNPSTDAVARDIELVLPFQEEFDLADSERRISVGSLEPEEEVTISSKVKMRAKKVANNIMKKTRVVYLNQFGEAFEVNVSTTIVKVQDKTNSDTFVFLTKETKAKVNNTDFFEVTLNVTNRGSRITGVDIEDGDFKRSLALNNGSSAAFTYKKRIETAGKYTLETATASYSFKDSKLVTGSNAPEIEIVDNPVISLEKVAPPAANNVENFEVEVKVKPLASGITNLTLNDEGKATHYDTVPEEISRKYEKKVKTVGDETLPAATAAYVYNGVLYEIKSNSPVVSIAEKELVTLSKRLSVNESKPGEDIKVYITAKSNANDEISVIISDGGETWEITLAPDEEKTVDYKTKASEIQAATATYAYDGEDKRAESNIPELTLVSEENGKVIKEENEKGILRKIFDAIMGVLTWQRD